MEKLIDIEGIGPAIANILKNQANLVNVEDLLQAGEDPKGRKALAEKTGLPPKMILRWVNMADLFRIKGVAEEYSDLLEAAGVDTVVELARRVPANLHQAMADVNRNRALVRRLPTLSDVSAWVEEAKQLDRRVNY